MSDELRAVAKQVLSGEFFDVRLAKEIIREWYSEHPSDDDEPVTDDWLESIGYVGITMSSGAKRFEIVDGIRVIMIACEGPRCWRPELWIGSGRCYVSPDPTKRRIRQIIAALGIEVPK